ncbi:ferric reductase NAD binding domain-containing protein [Trichoderma austrokoningii]
MASHASALARSEDFNHEQMYIFIGAVGGLAAIPIVFHLGRRLAQKTNVGKKGVSALAVLSRKPRNILLHTAPGLPSLGHAVLVSLYVAINLALTFTNIINPAIGTLGGRAAWMALANLTVLIFLALKNTPLAFLTAWSYERLNILHQIAGYMCIGFVIIHAACYTSYFNSMGRISVLREESVIYGEIAGLCFVIVGFAGAVIRRWWYELFYYVHMSGWIIAIVMVGLHQPMFAKRIIYVVFAVAGIWVLDRLVRVTRLLVYSVNNTATLTPLPNGGTRVTLKKAPLGAVSGQHCFLWIPSVRFSETHPFTIAAMDPMEFVVNSHDGFTQDLHQYALKNPGVAVKASVEGAYGTLPEASEYERVVLVAGGSGSTFTFGMALNMLRDMSPKQQDKKIVFILMVKYRSHLTWFASHLETLAKDPRVQLQVYVTRSSDDKTDDGMRPGSAPTTASSENEAEKAVPVVMAQLMRRTGSASEEADSVSLNAYEDCIRGGKPDVPALIQAEIESTPVEQRVLVLGCGPEGLMTQVRNTTAACIRSDGPGVELHCEQFGW